MPTTLDSVERRLAKIENRVDHLEKRIAKVENRLSN